MILLSHNDTVRSFLSLLSFLSLYRPLVIFRRFSDTVNTFNAKLFSENHRFSLKIFKTLEGHNSLNFGRRRKFQTFLEFSDKNLSKK